MKKNILVWIILFLVATLSCAPTNSSRHREGSNVGQETTLTIQDEQRLTREALPKMLKDYPAAKNQDLQKYISDLGMKIVRANKLEGNPYHYTFTVVDVVDVNAFAMPAGTVFVTAPLIALADNEAELAGVVAHEIGHVVARHAAERMDAMEKLSHVQVDLVIVDLNMPNMDGIEFVKNLRDNYYYMDTPVIMLTTTKDDKLKKDAFDAGVNMFLNKPVQPNFLLYKVESLLQDEEEING